MSRDFVITIVLIVVLFSVGTLANRVETESSRRTRYLCEQCAVERKVIKSKWLIVGRSNEDELIETLLSKRISKSSEHKCDHKWLWVYLDFQNSGGTGHGRVTWMYELFLLAEREELVSGLLNASEEMDRPPQDVWNRICLHLVSDSKWSSPFGNWINDNPRLDAEKTSEWIQANLDSLPIDTNQITRFKDME